MLFFLGSGELVNLSDLKIRRSLDRDILYIDKEGVSYIENAIEDYDTLSCEAEGLLRDAGLISKIFTTNKYADIFEGYDTEKEVGFIEENLLSRFPGEVCLDVGCGVGRVLLPLLSRGWKVDGLDSSVSIVSNLAGSFPENFQHNIYVADAAFFIRYDAYSCAFSSCNSIRYLATKSRLIRHFMSMRYSLKSGGFYLINITLTPEHHVEGARTFWSVGSGDDRVYYRWEIESRNFLMGTIEEKVYFGSDSEVDCEVHVQFDFNCARLIEILQASGGWSIQKAWDEYFNEIFLEKDTKGNVWVLLKKDGDSKS